MNIGDSEIFIQVMRGDCLPVMRNMLSDSVDLAYLDPPFFTGKKRRLLGRKQWQGEQLAFSDVWTTHSAYLEWMRERLLEVHRLLKPSGSIFLHCDWHANYLLRIEMDQIFHPAQFRGEVIWIYKRWTNSLRAFQRSHETLLFYSKTDAYRFNTLYEDYSFTTNIDQIWQKRGRGKDGKAVTVVDGNGDYVPLSQDKLGVPLRDVWEIPYVNPKARERVGYPTQKPIDLLKRVLLTTTNPGDLVLDPFCGSGTTLIAAKLLDRNCIGIDTSEEAVRITQSRLSDIGAGEGADHNTPYLLGQFLKLSRNEKINAISRQLPMNIAHRNRYIDGFLKRNLGGSSVPIRYVGSNPTPEVIEPFIAASRKRHCLLGLLVVDQVDKNDSSAVQLWNQSDFHLYLVSYEEICKPNWRFEVICHDMQTSLSLG